MSANRCELVLQVPDSARTRTLNLFRRACLLAVLTLWASVAAADTQRFYWDPNPETDLAGYVLVWGSQSGVYTQSVTILPDQTSHEVTYTCAPGSITYFALQAFNTANARSGYSNEVAIPCGTTTPVKLTPRSLGNVVVVIVTKG